MQSKCTEWRFKKSRFVKEREARWLLSNLGVKTPLSKIPLLGVLFWMQFNWLYKMNEIVTKSLLVGDKWMPGMQLKQPGFT